MSSRAKHIIRSHKTHQTPLHTAYGVIASEQYPKIDI